MFEKFSDKKVCIVCSYFNIDLLNTNEHDIINAT